MKSPIEEPRNVAVDVPARIKIMQNAKMDSISLAQMIDPLTQSEVSRLEERVIGLEKALAHFNQFADQFITYSQIRRTLLRIFRLPNRIWDLFFGPSWAACY